jgi:hypothetical protein
MNNKTKKYLRDLIFESSMSSVDEMADWKKMRGETKKFEKITDKTNNLVGWNVMGTPILFTCGADINQFIQENPELMDELKTKFGPNLKWEQGNLPACQPRRKMDIKSLPDDEGNEEGGPIDTSYVPSGEIMTSQEKIKRKLFNIIDTEFGNQEFAEVLNKRSIPTIIARDRRNISMYGRFDNDKIKYETHNYNGYESLQDFLKAAIARIKGGDAPEMKTYYLARQFNQNYRNWEADKKNQKQYAGKTDVYKLDAYGLEEKNLDVSIRMDFQITGERMGDSFAWNVRMANKIGKKMKEESGLRGGFLDDKIFQVSKTAQLDPGKTFDDKYTVVDDINVVNALMEAMEELKSQIEAIDPKETLKVANVKQYQVKRDVNESIKDRLVQRVITKIKRK